MWPFRTPPAPLPDLSKERLDALERDVAALKGRLAEAASWEASWAKITREMSRTLRSLAEIERREQLRRGATEEDDPLEEPEETLVERTLRFGGQRRG